jgi:putative FmdB family regulatory protein
MSAEPEWPKAHSPWADCGCNLGSMPIYEFRCQECEARFEARRPAELSDAPAPACPNGHASARRMLSVFATTGRSAGTSGTDWESPVAASGGGGCGPGCACART